MIRAKDEFYLGIMWLVIIGCTIVIIADYKDTKAKVKELQEQVKEIKATALSVSQ